MKIVSVSGLAPCLQADFLPDSALLRQGLPMFMPDFGSGWQLRVFMAVRICRLGKNISKKFASRYYDGIAAAMRMELPESDIDRGVLSGMDSSVVHGDWLPADVAERSLRIACGDVETSVPPIATAISEVISGISAYTTIKMGDIILLPYPADMLLPLSEGLRHEVTIDSTVNLPLRVV